MVDLIFFVVIFGIFEFVNKLVDLVCNFCKKGDDEFIVVEMRNILIDLFDDFVEVKSEFVSFKVVLLSKEEEI